MTRSLDIKIEIALDKNNVKYFPGDTIEGKIFLTSNQNCSLHEFRLNWSGRILVQPVSSNKDSRIYFDECWRLGPTLTKSKSKTSMGNSNVPLYHTDLILASNMYDPEPKLKLSKNKPIALSFSVQVPNDRPLPSCTEFNVSSNKIIYFLEAFILDQDTKFFTTRKQVSVYEAIYTRTEDKLIPIRIEETFMISTAGQERKEIAMAMRVTLPCQSCQAGVAIPVSISLWSDVEFVRRQGISINRVVADLEITSQDNQSHQKFQTVRVGLPVPKGTTPTVTFEQSQLLSISYFVRVQVLAQEGVYITPDGKASQFMVVDIPFSVGTLTTPQAGNSSSSSSSPINTPITSPVLSPVSPKTSPLSVSSPKETSSPTLSKATSSPTSPKTYIQSLPTSPNSTLLSINEPKRNSLSGIFRKSSTGSTSTQSSDKKKRFFSSLKLYSRNEKQEEEEVNELSQSES
ncbi:hypothetical protein EDC96DRAFT_412905, partial [Choanephora cucurbitarum]